MFSKQKKVHDVLSEIRKAEGTFSYKYGLIKCPHIFLNGIPLQKKDCEPNGYHHFVITQLSSIIEWVNENIVFQLDKDTYITTGVKIRIATGMLNQVQERKQFLTLAHDAMITNIKSIRNRLTDEDLPF